jgi:hypothetical protein
MERSRRNKGHKSATRSKEKDYVIVTVVEDMGKARDCKDLLQENEIPALIREQESASGESCIAVLVPEEHLDEAHVIVESQDNYDDFYDLDKDGDSEGDEEESEYGDREEEEEY